MAPSPTPHIHTVSALGAKRALALIPFHVSLQNLAGTGDMLAGTGDNLAGACGGASLSVQVRYKADAQRSHKPLVCVTPGGRGVKDKGTRYTAEDGSEWVEFDRPGAEECKSVKRDLIYSQKKPTAALPNGLRGGGEGLRDRGGGGSRGCGGEGRGEGGGERVDRGQRDLSHEMRPLMFGALLQKVEKKF